MKNIQLFKYQEEGIELIVNKYKNVLLADHPGAGKTCQAIIAVDKFFEETGYNRALVICPASLKENWRREFIKWSSHEYTIGVLNSKYDFGGFEVAIMSYDLAASSYNHYTDHIDILIIDEAHYLKNLKSQRTKAVLNYFWNKAIKVIAITGTPLPNGRAIEAYPLFSKLDPKNFKDKYAFINNYCVKQVTPWGINFNTSKNLEKLGEIARNNFMIRRKREDTVGQLPPLVRQKIFLNISVGNGYENIFNPNNELTTEVKSKWRKLGIEKVPASIQYILNLLKEVKNCVVFAHHSDVIKALKKELDANNVSNCLLIGEMSTQERQKSIDDFQDKKCRVFLGSIHAANVGITLTASSDIVFVECDWVPANNEQAEGRCFRISQTNVTRSHYLIIPDSLDELIISAVLKKQKDILKVMSN